MAKHRRATRLNPALVILSLFLGVLFVLSLFSFVDIRNSTPIASGPPKSQAVTPVAPTRTAPLLPTNTQSAPQIAASRRAINVPAPTTQQQKVPGTQRNVAPTSANIPPLPLPTISVVPTTKPLLKLDNGLEVNVPLLNLGVTVAPLK